MGCSELAAEGGGRRLTSADVAHWIWSPHGKKRVAALFYSLAVKKTAFI